MLDFATKNKFDHAAGVDSSDIAARKPFVDLKVDKLDINKLINIPTSLNNLKIKVNDIDVGKLKAVPLDLKKLINVVDNEVVKNTKVNRRKTKVNNLDKKIPDASIIVHINQYNTDDQIWEKNVKDFDKKIRDTSGLVTTVLNTKLSEAENKIQDTSSLVIT